MEEFPTNLQADSCTVSFKKLIRAQFLVSQFITFDRAVMTYKIVNQLCPEGLQNKFIERSIISKYNTRNRRDLHVQKLKLEYTKRGFLYTGPIAWME